MILLGIDPGLATVGYAFIDYEGRTYSVLEYGVLKTHVGVSTGERIYQIVQDLRELLQMYHPTICGMERLFFFRNVTNGIDVAQARGAILLTLLEHGVPYKEFTPLEVKRGIAGNGVAKKQQVQKSLQMLLQLKEMPTPDDAADALAVAYLTSLQIPQSIRGK